MEAQRFELSTRESFDLLSETPIGRLCIIDQGCPIAFPVNMRVTGTADDFDVVIRAAPDTIIGRYEGLASLETDEVRIEDGTSWSVIVRGSIHRVVGTHSLPDPEPMLSGRHLWLRLSATAISGRRFALRRGDDGFTVEWQMLLE